MARVKSYVTLERNGFVFLWYHAEGIDPVWEPPEIEEIAGGQWKYCGRSEHHINAHIEVLHLLCYIVMAELFYCLFNLVLLKPNSITLAGSELAPNMFGASSELASVMEFGF